MIISRGIYLTSRHTIFRLLNNEKLPQNIIEFKNNFNTEGKSLAVVAVGVNDSNFGKIRLNRIKDASSQTLHDAISCLINFGGVFAK